MILRIGNIHLNERQFGSRSFALFLGKSFFLFRGESEVGIKWITDKLSPNSESFAHVVEVVKVEAFLVSNDFEQVALKAAFAEAVIEPAVALEFDFNGSSVSTFSVTANWTDDFTLIRIAT